MSLNMMTLPTSGRVVDSSLADWPTEAAAMSAAEDDVVSLGDVVPSVR